MRHNFLIGPTSKSPSLPVVTYEPPNVHETTLTQKRDSVPLERQNEMKSRWHTENSFGYIVRLFWGESCLQNGHLAASSPLH